MKRLLTVTAIAFLLIAQSDVCCAQWVQTNGPYGGETPLCFASNDSVIYVGTNIGIYLSKDSGANWNFMGFADTSVLAIEVNDGFVFAGTENGIFKTDDTGMNWVEVDTEIREPVYSFLAAQGVLFVGTSSGLFSTSDDGTTWLPRGLSNESITGIVEVDGKLTASSYSAIFGSTDNGLNWENHGGGNMTALINYHGIIFVGSPQGGAGRSTDGGITWTTPTNQIESVIAFTILNDMLIAVGNNEVGNGGFLYTSTDSGNSWTESNGMALFESVIGFGNNLFCGVDGDLVITSDLGNTWNDANTGITGTTVLSLTITGDSVLAGLQRGGLCISGNNGQTWPSIDGYGGDVQWSTVVDRTLMAGVNNEFLGNGSVFQEGYNTGWQGWIADFANRNDTLFSLAGWGLFRSTDTGFDWSKQNDGWPGGQEPHSIAIMGRYILAGLDSGVYRSLDDGLSWAQVSLNTETVIAMAVSGNFIFASTFDGVFRLADSGLYATNANFGLPSSVTRIISVQGTLFASTWGNGVFLSSDDGVFWESANDGLLNFNVKTITASGEYLYIGCAPGGVWRRPLSDFGLSTVAQTLAASPPQIQSYPNPFTQSTTITFSSQNEGYANVTVVNLLGEQVARIFSGELSPGEHSFSWDASGISPGMYECIVRVNGNVQRVSMICSR